MADFTAKGRIGCFVEELTLAGVVYNTAGLQHQLQMGTKFMLGRRCEGSGMLDEPSEPANAAELAHAAAELNTMRNKHADYEQLHASGSDVALLTDVFNNFAANTKRRGLISLSIDVVEYRQDTKTTQPASGRLAWRSVWHMAEQTFHTFTLALGGALLPIRALNFFCNDVSGRCSIQCHQLSRCDWSASGIVFNLATVESLSISISDRVLDETAHDALSTGDPVERASSTAGGDTGSLLPNLEELKKQATEDENCSGLVTLLNSCKKLSKLDLRRCYVRRRRAELDDPTGERFIQRLAEGARLENLRILSLGNFMAKEQDLICFLQRHPVRDLTLVNISLESGAWNDIFDYCTTTMHALHLENLCQDYHTILFGDSHEEIESSLMKGLRKSQNIYTRQGKDLEKPIAWTLPRFRRLGPDPVVDGRIERLRNMFGPPASHYPGVHH